jgi:hypothetical protein
MMTEAQKKLQDKFESILERLDSGESPLYEDVTFPSLDRCGNLHVISTMINDERELLCLYHHAAPEIADFYVAERGYEYKTIFGSPAKRMKSVRF